jgi:pimeloyl-ACP methyl ester carboxylesterase
VTTDRPFPAVAGVRHDFHQAGAVRLHVAEAGDGPVVLMLHGWPQHWYEWRHLIPPLAKNYRVICPDLRGFGWSEAPRGGYDKETLTRDIIALLDEMGIERVRLVGHDWGGWVGFLLCLLAPERVERYLALNMATPLAPPSLEVLSSMWRFWYHWLFATPGLGPAAMRQIGRGGDATARLLGAHCWDQQATRAFLDQFKEPERAHAAVQLYRSFQVHELPRVLAGRYRGLRLRTPTMLLYGVLDPVVRPAHFAGYEHYADEMSVEMVPGCGHFIADDLPDLVLERARAWFA